MGAMMRMLSQNRALDKLYKRRDRYEIPDWQREGDVWALDRQQKLIDTILRGWHLPKFYFVKVEGTDDYYEVVDGQQRLNTIWAFYEGRLELAEEAAKKFGGAVYSKLPLNISDDFDDFEIQYEEISDATEGERRELFQRLQLGVALTPDERLNAVTGKLRDFCRKHAKHSFFQNKVSFPDHRYAYFGVCVRFAYLEIEGIPNQLRFPELEELLGSHGGFAGTSPSAVRMKRSLDFLDKAFDTKSAALRKRTSVLALLRLSAQLVEKSAPADRAKQVGDFFEAFNKALRKEVEKGSDAQDTDLIQFQESITSNLTSGQVIRTRERTLLKRDLYT